jgi:hypothetical protein
MQIENPASFYLNTSITDDYINITFLINNINIETIKNSDKFSNKKWNCY